MGAQSPPQDPPDTKEGSEDHWWDWGDKIFYISHLKFVFMFVIGNVHVSQ